jgi:hypothetical protein
LCLIHLNYSHSQAYFSFKRNNVLSSSFSLPVLAAVAGIKPFIVRNLQVKQQCVFKQFIAINTNLEVDARVFISNNQNGEVSKTAERQR